MTSPENERAWFQLSSDELIALPPDELGLRILVQLGPGSETRAGLVGRIPGGSGAPREAKQAVTEAWWWLIRKGLLVPDAQNSQDEWWLASRLGQDVASRSDGLARLRAGERIDVELHPKIAADVRAEFLRGKFETAVFVAMRQVEIAIREASGAEPNAYGQGLLGRAFGSGGTLIDSEHADAEEQGIANLFRGALAALKKSTQPPRDPVR